MKAWIISDLHTSKLDLLYSRQLAIPRADLCVCAGDISDRVDRSVHFLLNEISPHMPVVFVLGNHDYYRTSIDAAQNYARKWTAGTNVHFLENDVFIKDDLRVIGSTLWTDYKIKAHAGGHLPVGERRLLAMRECTRLVRDFYEIERVDLRRPGEGGMVTADELAGRHGRARAFIKRHLAKSFAGTTMVLTHHAPLPRSLDRRFAGKITNAAFASDLSLMIRRGKPDFWIHGHVHCHHDYVEGDTRIICNPRGYHHEDGLGGFLPGLVIETRPMTDKDTTT